jgi:hypothetical protein
MTTSLTRSYLPWIARAGALASGVALLIFGLNIAADFGEILVGVPFYFLSGLGLAFGATGRFPPRWRLKR